MSFSVWAAEVRNLRAIDRAHRSSKQSSVTGRQLVPSGRIAAFLTVCFAVVFGAALMLPVDRDVPSNIVVILGASMVFYAPFSTAWLGTSDFERLHAPPAALLLFRLSRLLPYLLTIGVLWAGLLWTRRPDPILLLAVLLLPTVLGLSCMLRQRLLTFVFRLAMAVCFLGSWVGLNEWLPIASLAMCLIVIVAFVRDLAVYDQEGFVLEPQIAPTRMDFASIAPDEPLPDVRKTSRRSLLANAWLYSRSRARGFGRVWRRQPLTASIVVAVLGAFRLAAVMLSALAVWLSVEEVYALVPILAALVSVTMLDLDEEEPLYLFGVDLQEIERHRIRARLITVVLPCVLAAVAMLFMAGATDARWAAVAWVSACQLLRIGVSWCQGEFRLLACLLILGGLVIAAITPRWSVDTVLPVAAILAFLGLVGMSGRLLAAEQVLRRRAFE